MSGGDWPNARPDRWERWPVMTWRGLGLFATLLLSLLMVPAQASASTELGGVNLEQYCQAHGYASAVLLGSPGEPNAAFHWRCQTGSTEASIDVTAACREQYGDPSATAQALDVNNAYSWRCFGSTGYEPPGTPSYEPNDTIATATGPLAGGSTYSEAIQTQNDEDWYFFYTNGTQQLDISFTNLTNGCTNLILSLLNGNGEGVGSSYARPDPNTTSHILYTASTAARYYLHVVDPYDNPGCQYQLRVDPAGALTSQPPYIPPPPEVSSGCRAAQRRVAILRSRLRHATSRRQRNRLRAKLRQARSTVTSRC
jgi:hypothetical protein